MMGMDKTMNRGYGLMIVEAVNSNINGDPDFENDPRTDTDGYGVMTGVSVHRKLRDLVDDKEGPAWEYLKKKFENFDPAQFDILEKRDRSRKDITDLDEESFKQKYWDARVFGSTFLEEEKKSFINTGVVHFALGRTVAPVEIMRYTMTNKAGVQEGKDRGMAPLAYRVVRHGLYVAPFHVNPARAHLTGCSAQDIKILLALIPYIYTAHESLLRTEVHIRHIWYAEHKSPMGSCPEYMILEAMMPRKKENPHSPSTSVADYEIPKDLSQDIRKKLTSFKDLMADFLNSEVV